MDQEQLTKDSARQSRKGTPQVSKWLFYLALLPAIWGVCAWQGWAWWSWASAPPKLAAESTTPSDATAVSIQIPEGTSSQKIGRDLEAAGLIRSASAWNMWARWLTLQNREGGFKAGTYQLSPTQPLGAVADKLWKGEVVQQSFTIPEGWSLTQMSTYFEAQGFFPAKSFMAAVSQVPYAEYPWLPSGLPHLEGFLYPDTYQLDGDTVTPEAVIKQMLGRFEQVALPVYQKNQKNTKLDLKEWVTLASIVEKEAVVASERNRISGVFNSRLKKSMPLASDPTVEYGLGIRQTKEKPLTFKQVETPSPYNTYINVGLPPTPIAAPGIASLEATLAPENTEYLYFMARYDGTHIFSRTLAEHNAAVAQIDQKVRSGQ
ncbi:MAG: endolytic transglycosylase MltG [Tychonema bourrellyi B0820]|uniref:Endolytic murein transglycosylase n=1 Tax=Tychonema bourrellyi FEM_GT703 TaxID=2040638 RepID=A0A2G4EUX1_9CYAN|nr:endolytic transglycosylase MltG [Tychonema bourrellyi]MDQ2100696.1 endolytic transglycosylase MltG [Tychonema bourrellyi B0820]PHX53230.1 aminodeoxychorismate lyase [Tychonema bourrellyi FEM_GT703]